MSIERVLLDNRAELSGASIANTDSDSVIAMLSEFNIGKITISVPKSN